MGSMNLLSWLLFGVLTGVIANVIDPRPSQGGILGAMVLGIIGAVVGGFLANAFFGNAITGFNITSFMIAVLGSLLALFVGRALTRGEV